MGRVSWTVDGLLAVFVYGCLWKGVDGVQFYLDSGSKRCFEEQVKVGSKVHGEYVVVTGAGDMTVDLTVRDEKGRVVYMKRDVNHGSFVFNTPDAGQVDDENVYYYANQRDSKNHLVYRMCVENQGEKREGIRRRVSLRVLQGAIARDFVELARVEHLDALRTRLAYVLSALQDLYDEFEELQIAERDLRDANEQNLRRMLISSIASILSLFIFGILRMYHTRSQLKRIRAI